MGRHIKGQWGGIKGRMRGVKVRVGVLEGGRWTLRGYGGVKRLPGSIK